MMFLKEHVLFSKASTTKASYIFKLTYVKAAIIAYKILGV